MVAILGAVNSQVMGSVEAKVSVGGKHVQSFCLLFCLTLGSRRDETITGLRSIEEYDRGSNRNAGSDYGQERQSRVLLLGADLMFLCCLAVWFS